MHKAIITIGLGFGDEGKGTTVDFLCRQLGADLVVKYCGGCQCAHNVVLPDGKHHTFSQFGSGTFTGVPTYLGPHFIISLPELINEANHLVELGIPDPYSLLRINPRCLISTDFHKIYNRKLEQDRGNNRHGSCGLGIGATREFSLKYPTMALRWEDLDKEDITFAKLCSIQEFAQITDKCLINSVYCQLLQDYKDITDKIRIIDDIPYFKTAIFEGSQGILLDEKYGTAPHNTWSNVTTDHAIEMLQNQNVQTHVMGCIRPYATRHGNGPLPSYNRKLTERLSKDEIGNPANKWQDSMRYGHFDMYNFHYALEHARKRIDSLSINCLDQIDHSDNFIEQMLHIRPISVLGYGPTHLDKRLIK